MLALELLQTRSSTPSRLLQAPGPTRTQLEQMLELAMRVPDHGKLTPWRFVLIAGDARQQLSELLVERFLALKADSPPEAIDKERQRFLFAPCIVAVIASITPAHKIPESEQHASASAVCMQLLNAAQALGFGAQWLTAWAAYDAMIKARLGLTTNEHIAGFIHIGSSATKPIERTRPALAEKLSSFGA
jgi:nitroreductase